MHEGTFSHPNQVFRDAWDSLEEFHRQNSRESEETEHTHLRQVIQWQPPPDNKIKVIKLGCECGQEKWPHQPGDDSP